MGLNFKKIYSKYAGQAPDYDKLREAIANLIVSKYIECSNTDEGVDKVLRVLYKESGLDCKNSQSYYVNKGGINLPVYHVGLFQASSDNLKNWGITKEKFVKTIGSKQIPYLLRYIEDFGIKDKFKTAGELGVFIFFPKAYIDKQPDSYEFPEYVQLGNNALALRDFDSKKKITVGSYKRYIEDTNEELSEKSNDVIKVGVNVEQTTILKDVFKGDVNENSIQTIQYTHIYNDIKTLNDLIKYKGWRDSKTGKQITSDELINYKSNRQNIRDSYNFKEDLEINPGEEEYYITTGAVLEIPVSWISVERIPVDGQQIIISNNDTETFISKAITKIVTSPSYVFYNSTQTENSIMNGFKKVVPKYRVWVWCKALGLQKDIDGMPRYTSNGALIDVSPYIINVNTQTSKGGGAFSFTLPPLLCESSEDGWRVKQSTLQYQQSGFVSKVNLLQSNSKRLRNEFLFNTILSNNDVVFISLDTPTEEPIDGLNKTNFEKLFNDFKIPEDYLAGNFYDMIGLVDVVSQNVTPQGNVVLNVSGRDLMKLFIEDSSTYLITPNDDRVSEKSKGVIFNDDEQNWGRPIRSIIQDNQIGNLPTGVLTVGDMLNFIISNLATIEVAPDSLFSSYKNQEANKQGFGISRYLYWNWGVNKNKKTAGDFSLCKAAGIWQIIKLQIDNYAVNDRSIINKMPPTYSGSILNAMKLFVDGVFVEMFGDTYIDQYFLLVRRPPFNLKSITDYKDKIISVNDSGARINSLNVVSEKLQWYSGDVYCWYKIEIPQDVPSGVTIPFTGLPVVFFREYCEIWGNKPLYIPSNYHPRDVTKGGIYQKQVYEDLAYLVESNSYLPFTRTGTITIKGDRRIKRGIWIVYEPTNELYYVDDVIQFADANGERTTTLQVSRGMVISNKTNQDILSLYFKIIDGLEGDSPKRNPPKLSEKTKTYTYYFNFDTDDFCLIDAFRQGLIQNPLFEDDVNARMNLQEKNRVLFEKFVEFLHTQKNFFLTINGYSDENYPDVELSKKRAESVKEKLVYYWGMKFSDVLDESKIITNGFGVVNLLQSSKDISDLTYKRIVDSKNRRIEFVLTQQKIQTPISTPTTNRFTDFTKWKVNQGIFNFFKARKQFSDYIEDFDEIGTYSTPTAPTPFEVEKKPYGVEVNVQITPAKQVLNNLNTGN